MKAGDKITIGGITLKAYPKESAVLCRGCYFHKKGECATFDLEMSIRPKCWDKEWNDLIFKKELI